MKKNIKCLDEFYIRVPFNSMDYYNLKLKNLHRSCDCLNTIKKSNNEIILNTSKELYFSLDDKRQNQKKSFMSYLKYLIRSSTRATPYGLLSGVGLGNFDESYQNNIGGFYKYTKVDSEWLCNLIKIYEEKIDDSLQLCFNNSLITLKDRIYKICNTFYSEDMKDIDIKNGPIINKLKDFCSYGNFKSKNQIIGYLYNESKDKDLELIKKFTNELFCNEILISDLRIPTINVNEIEYLLDKLKFYNQKKDYNLLLRLKQLIEEYDRNDINSIESIKKYFEIIDFMKGLHECKNYLHTDLFFDKKIILEKNIQKEIEDFCNFLILFDDGKYKFEDYYNKFIDRYGFTCVKFLDVISNKGIGYPMKNQNSDSSNLEILKNYILKNDNKVIDLSDLKLPESKNKNKCNNFEIALFVYENNKEYFYALSPMGGSDMIGKSFGRFAHCFPNNKIIQNSNNTIELSFIPQIPRILNVLSCQSGSDKIFELSVCSKKVEQSMNLDDIYIFPRDGVLLFYDVKKEQIVDFTATNMLNTIFYPDIMKVLINLTCAKYSNYFILLEFLETIYKNQFYSPEIRYKNFIISPETWTFKTSIFNNKKNKQSTLEEFENLRKIYNIKSIVNVGKNDNYLMLNLNNPNHIDVLYDLISKEDYLEIKKYDIHKNILLSDNKNEKHIGEFVFQIECQDNKEIKQMNLPFYQQNIVNRNTFLPLDRCIYMKIYSNKKYLDYLLTTYIFNYINKTNVKLHIKSWFYIRYIDKDSHIRLRIFYDQFDSSLFNILKDFQNELYQSGLVSNIIYDSYEREYLRYGGENHIEFFENYFNKDSIDILNFLKRKSEITKEVFFVITCIQTMNNLRYTKKQMLSVLNDFKLNKEYRKKMRDFKKENVNLINSVLKNNNTYIKDLTKNINVTENNLYLKLNNGEFNNLNFNDILLSLLHMRFNRLIGIDRYKENMLMSFIENIIYSEEKREYYEIKSNQ